jgi:hypothetical protein
MKVSIEAGHWSISPGQSRLTTEATESTEKIRYPFSVFQVVRGVFKSMTQTAEDAELRNFSAFSAASAVAVATGNWNLLEGPRKAGPAPMLR